jgi:hypothetical protein
MQKHIKIKIKICIFEKNLNLKKELSQNAEIMRIRSILIIMLLTIVAIN